MSDVLQRPAPPSCYSINPVYADWEGKWTWNEAPLDPQDIKEGIDAVQDAINRAAWKQWY